jgi:DNA mismatch repair protein MutL
MSIHILPSEVASQIAAGEVIERPASVVKELLENSIDAGASAITINVEDAGKRLIEVADDGCGIPAQELALAVERHATSKLLSAEDLFKINTLGFRGEALASIGSVARLTITSRSAESEVGARLRVEGGLGEAVQAIGSPPGTVVQVGDLFYNVPARLKFLKTDTTERRQIDTLVTRYALAYPSIRFQLKQDGKPALQTSGNGKRREVLAALYGVEVARQMLEVLSDEDGLGIQGFISSTSLTRSNRREIVFFVNGRPVQDATLVAALIKAYHTLLMVGRYPLGILFLETPPEAVDVNVHPTKAEVRFRDPNRVFTGVQSAVRRALLAHTPVPRLDNQLRWTPEPDWGFPAEATDLDWQDAQKPGLQAELGSALDDSSAHSSFQPGTAGQSSQPGLPGARIPLLRLVGQIASAYLVAEGPDGLYLIDQHAAHERVLFERFMAQRNGEIPSQALLQPVTVELPAASARLLEPQLPILQHLGFDVEPFGFNTYLVRAIPNLLSGSDPAAALRVLVEDFEEDETPLRAEVEARIVARVCKRAAVKAGHTLSAEEQKALLADLEACQSPRTCPHGRPTMIHLSVDLLEKQFGRRGAR